MLFNLSTSKMVLYVLMEKEIGKLFIARPYMAASNFPISIST